MTSVSTVPNVKASVKFRRAALAVQWSVKAKHVIHSNKYAQAEVGSQEDKHVNVVRGDPIQLSAQSPAFKTETKLLPAPQSISTPHSSASVKFRRAAITVKYALMAHNAMPQPTIPEPKSAPEIKDSHVEEKKEIMSSKPKTSVKFRRAAIALEVAVKANRTIHQPHFAKVATTSEKEAQNFIEAALNCIADTSAESATIEDASMGAPTIEVEKTEVAAAAEDSECLSDEMVAPLPRRSCLKSPDSFSSKVKKSVKMKRHARVRKILPRSSYTEDMVASVWYSRSEFQAMLDKYSRKMERHGISGSLLPSRAPVVATEPSKSSAHNASKKQKVAFASGTKASDKLMKRKLPDFGSDMFPMLNIAHQLQQQMSTRAA